MGKNLLLQSGHGRLYPNVPSRHRIASSRNCRFWMVMVGSGLTVEDFGRLRARHRGSIRLHSVPPSPILVSCHRCTRAWRLSFCSLGWRGGRDVEMSASQ
jgi:hypothetical protein